MKIAAELELTMLLEVIQLVQTELTPDWPRNYRMESVDVTAMAHGFCEATLRAVEVGTVYLAKNSIKL